MNLKKIFLTIGLFLALALNAHAAQEDAWSYAWWSEKSGITTGTVNDIISEYLGNLGYSGTVNDRLHAFLVNETGLPSSLDLQSLIYVYFVEGDNSNPDQGDLILLENGNFLLTEDDQYVALE